MGVRSVENKRILMAFVIVNAAIYVGFMAVDVSQAAGYALTQTLPVISFAGDLPGILKYVSIVLCLLFVLIVWRRGMAWRGRDARLQAVVFAFTLVADWLLLFTDKFTAGVVVFLCAHMTALRRYKPGWVSSALSGVGAALVMAFGAAVYVGAKAGEGLQEGSAAGSGGSMAGERQFLVICCVIYAALIVTVTVAAFLSDQPRRNVAFARTGMCLFLLCDICVAIYNVLPDIILTAAASAEPFVPAETLVTVAGVLMWAFYLPAQTLLALSVCGFTPRRHRRHRRRVG